MKKSIKIHKAKEGNQFTKEKSKDLLVANLFAILLFHFFFFFPFIYSFFFFFFF